MSANSFKRWGKVWCVGAFLGMLIVNISSETILKQSHFLDADFLIQLKIMNLDKGQLFIYYFRQRMGVALALGVVSTTYLGGLAGIIFLLWFGGSIGIFFAMALLRYGVKGILLFAAGIFPHYLFYVPAFGMLLYWGRRVCKEMYAKKHLNSSNIIEAMKESKVMFAAVAMGLILIGVYAEAFWNIPIIQGLLKIF